MTLKHGILLFVFYVITFGIAKSQEYPLVTIKEYTSNRIVIEWESGSKQSVWERDKKTTLYKHNSTGCGLPDSCTSELYLEAYENIGCVLASRWRNYNSNYIAELGRYRTKVDGDCSFFDKNYFIADISDSFRFMSNGVELIDSNYERRGLPIKNYRLDVSKDGSKILSSIFIKKDNPYLTSLMIFDLKARTAKQIVFLNHCESYELLFGFINESDFVVLTNNTRLDKKSEYSDPIFGMGVVFDQNMAGTLLKYTHDSVYKLCTGDVDYFGVDSKGISIAGSTGSVCGSTTWVVNGRWKQRDLLQPIYVEGLGDPGVHINIMKDKVNITNYGYRNCNVGNNYGEYCNSNESFFQVATENNSIKISKYLNKDSAIVDVIPEEGYLYPVWQKSYDGLKDISASINAYKDDEYLHLELDITDENLVLSNKNELNNDHVELWLFTGLMQLEKSMNYNEESYLDSLIGQTHLSLSANTVTSLDNEMYTQVGIKSSVFQPIIENIKSKFNRTENGYFHKISIPFNSLPFYQLKDKRQCVGVMVDVIDVDDANKQETLLSNNINRAWGRRYGAPKVCFEIEEDLSAVRFVNKEGVAIDKSMNDMAIVVKDKQGYNPMQFHYLKPKAKPFSKIKPINYRQLDLFELPESERKKIKMNMGCSIVKAFYQQEQQELVLLSACPMPNTHDFISVIKLGEKPRFLMGQKNYYASCYRHCGNEYPKRNIENLKYGILDDDINVIQIDKAAFYFSKTKNISGDLDNHGFPKLAEEIKARIDLGIRDRSLHGKYPFNKTMLLSEEPLYIRLSSSNWINDSVINISDPLEFNGEKLELSPMVYGSSFFSYTSSDSNDIYCLEKEVVENYIVNGELKLPQDLELNCLSKYFDLQQLDSNVVEFSVHDGDVFFDNQQLKSIKSLSLHAVREIPRKLDLKGFDAINKLYLRGNRGRNPASKVKLGEKNQINELLVDSAFDVKTEDLNNVEKMTLTSCKHSWPKLPALKTLVYECNKSHEIYRELPYSQITSLEFKGAYNQDFVDKIFKLKAIKRLSLDSNFSQEKNVISFPNSAESLEELSLKLYHSEEIKVLESLPNLTNLKHLSLAINFKVDGGINSYLQLLKDLPLESFSLTNVHHNTDDKAIDIPFSKSLKKLQLSINGNIKEGSVFPSVLHADIKGSRVAFNNKDLGKIFPNIEKLEVESFIKPFQKSIPESFKKLVVASGIIDTGNQQYPKLDELTFLRAEQNSFLHLNGLTANRYYFQDRKSKAKELRQVELVSYASFQDELLNYYDPKMAKAISDAVLYDCNHDRNTKDSDDEKSQKLLSISSSCVAKALWRVDAH